MIKAELQIKALSVNKAFQGKRYKTKECKIYERFIEYSLPKKQMIRGKVWVQYDFFLQNHANTDCDNLVKILQDCIVRCGYIEDDRKIYKIIINKIPCKFYNKIVIAIGELKQ